MVDTKKEITYLFGAGASFESMPLVKNFSERFRYFIKFLTHCDFQDDFIKACNVFVSEIENHQSFDTFFKKLFHKNRQDHALHCKKILLIYFFFEHKVNIREEEKFFKNKRPDKFLKDLGKSGATDKRYDALLASLLIPTNTKIEFFKKTNFITWNYDANLIQAILNFTGISDGVYSFQNKFMTKKYFENENFSITRLNGEIIRNLTLTRH